MSLRPSFYDAEYDLGLIAESQSASDARRNTDRLTAALTGQHPLGNYAFTGTRPGPVIYPIRFAAKEFFFRGTVTAATRMGGGLYGYGSRGYMLPSGHYNEGGTLGGAVTRFTRIDGENGGAILDLPGAGFTVDGIEFHGRPYIVDPTGEGPTSGTKTPIGIGVDGRSAPSSGRHRISNCLIAECTTGILARGTPVATHADNCLVDHVSFYTVSSCFRSENGQAVCWKFRDIEVNGLGGVGATPCIVADIVSGGDVWVDGLSLNHPTATLFKVTNYNPNAQRLVCHNLKWDQGTPNAANYLTLFNYSGPVYAATDMSSTKFSVRVTGNLSNSETPIWDSSQLIVIPDGAATVGIDRSDLLFDISRLPHSNFTILGAGPWYSPTP